MKTTALSKDRIVERSTTAAADIEVRVAGTLEEYEQAFRIAYEVYHPLGFTPDSSVGMRVSPSQLKPSAVVLIAYRDGRAVGTMSLYEDGSAGVPSDAGWPEELNGLRTEGRRLFELGTLMVLPRQERGMRICLELFRHAWLYAASLRGADTFCAFVQARHEWFYRKMMGFRPFGPTKFYCWSGLRIGDVLPLFLDLVEAEDDFRRRFERRGESPRNLYRYFTKWGRAETEAQLRTDLAVRARLDRREFMRRFEKLAAVEAEAAADAAGASAASA